MGGTGREAPWSHLPVVPPLLSAPGARCYGDWDKSHSPTLPEASWFAGGRSAMLLSHWVRNAHAKSPVNQIGGKWCPRNNSRPRVESRTGSLPSGPTVWRPRSPAAKSPLPGSSCVEGLPPGGHNWSCNLCWGRFAEVRGTQGGELGLGLYRHHAQCTTAAGKEMCPLHHRTDTSAPGCRHYS